MREPEAEGVRPLAEGVRLPLTGRGVVGVREPLLEPGVRAVGVRPPDGVRPLVDGVRLPGVREPLVTRLGTSRLRLPVREPGTLLRPLPVTGVRGDAVLFLEADGVCLLLLDADRGAGAATEAELDSTLEPNVLARLGGATPPPPPLDLLPLLAPKDTGALRAVWRALCLATASLSRRLLRWRSARLSFSWASFCWRF